MISASKTASTDKEAAGKVRVAIAPHPFAAARMCGDIDAGATVEEIIRHFQPSDIFDDYAHVFLNGHAIPKRAWKRIRPKGGTSLTVRMVPAGGGGGGKSPLRMILTLALAVAVPYAMAGLSAELGFTALGSSSLLRTGFSLLTTLALNALAPPAKARFADNAKESPTLFLQAAQNQSNPFGRVPKVLGKHRSIPPLGGNAYTETVGADQYLRMLFVWGYGPLNITDLKIGETPLSEFEGVDVETRQGYDDDAPLTLYSNSVLQNDLQVTLTNLGGAVIRTSDADADELSIDVTLPRGLMRLDDRGNKTSTSVQVEVCYSPAGMNDWSAGADSFKDIGAQSSGVIEKPDPYTLQGVTYATTRIDRIVLDAAGGFIRVVSGADFRNGIDAGAPAIPGVPTDCLALAQIIRRSDDADAITAVIDERDASLTGTIFESAGDFAPAADGGGGIAVAAGGLRFMGVQLTAKQSAALRDCIVFRVPKGQYDVRLRRVTADAIDDNTFDDTVWTALRTLRYSYPITMPGLAVTAIRIKATDQLNGVIDQFNGVVQALLPDWNGSDWVVQPTSNPASLFRHVLQGNANARPLDDARLDLARLEEWHDSCTNAGREFNAIIDYDTSVRDVLENVAAAGRAAASIIDGKWAVVEDRPQAVPVQHFTPQNTYKFEGQKSFDELPQALRVRFINRDKGWLQDERLVFDDGYDAATATRYDSLSLSGITSSDQAWSDGRYHIATARLRPETYTFFCDIEHIVCTRGDLVRFTHDVPLFGLLGARVAQVIAAGGTTTGVILNADVAMEDGKSYAVRFRLNDGTSLLAAIQTAAGKSRRILFATPLVSAGAPLPGDLALFGESGQESVELIVKSIEPQGGLNAKLTLVDAAPGVFAADGGVIPAHDSQISLPASFTEPQTPTLSQIQSGEEVLVRNTDGSITTRIVITLGPPSFPQALSVQVLIRASDESGFHRAEATAQGSTRVSITDVADGETYDIQLRYMTASGTLSDALVIASHRVTGASANPSDVAGFSMNVLGSAAHLSWQAVTDIDLDHYTLRFSPQLSGAAWNSAVDIVSQIAMDATSITVPAASGTYLIKAVDVTAHQSTNAAMAVSTIAALAGYNAVLEVDEDAAWAGAKTSVATAGHALQLTGADSIDDWDDTDNVPNLDIGYDGMLSEGNYIFAETCDLGACYTSRLTADIALSGLDMNDGIDTWNNTDTPENWDQDVDPSLWSVVLQLRTTSVDPAAESWGDWSPFVIGDYTARAFQFRVLLSARSNNVTPSVSRLRISIDMPDRTLSAFDLSCDPAGANIGFDTPFRDIPAIAVTAQDMASGDYYAVTAKTAAGFTIRFYNSAGDGIRRQFDYLAKGYGEQI